ncbi:hypothetical protein [Streptomyces sp. NPDC014656]|uniref:hypothetical protein n=1 Tax=Streptomyces sp. NPDC014656 TaxID=3364878 RepID=UPI0037015C69
MGFDALHVDRLAESGMPMDRLLHLLGEAEIVVADLEGGDEELVFALGARHALGRRTLHVTEKAGTFLPSSTAFRIAFPSCSADIVTARQRLTILLGAESQNGVLASSPSPPPAFPPDADTDASDDVPGLFDLVMESESQMEALSGDMDDVDAAMTDLKAMLELFAKDMTRMGRPGTSSSEKVAVLNRLAKALDGPAGDLEDATGRFEEHLGASAGAFGAFMEWAAKTPRSRWPEGADAVLEQLVSAPWGAAAAEASMREGMETIRLFGSASRRLRRPTRRITSSIESLLKGLSAICELQDAAAALRDS